MTNTASWYHCSVKSISRSTGRTAIAAAAYRSGTRLHDNQLDKTYDYTRRRGVEDTFILAPSSAPEWAYNLESLWNEAQARDNRKNSCLAREIELALPSAIDAEGRAAIAREFSQHLVERYGVAVSAALHEPSRHGDRSVRGGENNYHAHILFTTRRMDEDGLGAKTRELDVIQTSRGEVEHIREYAASLINSYLEDAGSAERVDHRSYKDRGIDQTPTEHLGVEAAALERKGEPSRIGDENREIAERNGSLETLKNELAIIETHIDEEVKKSAPEIAEPVKSWEEQKAEAQRNFDGDVTETFKRDIEAGGEVKEYGLGKNWFDRSLALFENLYYDTIEVFGTVKDKWQEYIGKRDREQDRDRDDPDKGDMDR